MKTRIAATMALAALIALAACAQAPQPAPAPAPVKIAMKESVAETGAPAGAQALYAAQCAGCHGQAGEKGLKGKTAEQVVTALKSYQAGTYGGAKKEIMQARAARLSNADIGSLATLVARF